MTSRSKKQSPLRAELLKEQVAHLKVLLNVSKQLRQARVRDVQVATQNLMVAEAEIASFSFRINEHLNEIDAITKSKGKKER